MIEEFTGFDLEVLMPRFPSAAFEGRDYVPEAKRTP